jgi:LPXTG-motif cell wall-anchored protein
MSYYDYGSTDADVYATTSTGSFFSTDKNMGIYAMIGIAVLVIIILLYRRKLYI